jgi:hypothetical protein
LSELGVTLDSVDVSAEAVAKVPGENLRVPRTEFGDVCVRAEHLGGQPDTDDDYLIGVLRTCRWLVYQPVPSILPGRVAEMPWSPLTRRVQRPIAALRSPLGRPAGNARRTALPDYRQRSR